ncbi:helix-turn-helix domain-containing protein [Variovorax sp. CF313]|uniref:helix-turn-helix domain-containing protein n=1 Tax=Variovorax sp. CF313 TaxID=1144315 RepID=UPI0009DB0832|nr:MerR family transcriptional regulator [Variovorax sp. CF313]
MWIKEFSESAGLPVATVRFYVKSKLLHPKLGTAGGSRPYMEFSEKDLWLTAAIKAGQALGISLAEIKSLIDERRGGDRTKAKLLQTMISHRQRLSQRATEVAALIQFVDAKISWLRGGSSGPMPEPP